ncbi:hypothetical protein SAMN05216456_1891 [Devosia crocina]|uniref:Uncharacterized protein n=1 Tax=Devosia crocina TaxID=429728 RepID=A0A1I7NEM9_9HYPH|nr:hypothetical protein [Devosia crocina]SFV33118.1 hypothetical protein SAMN05216456_1891 [Devosia crocina]
MDEHSELRAELDAIGVIEQPYQAFALVGFYMSMFAAMEMSLNELLGQLMRITWPQQRIVVANMDLAQKVHTARALLRETQLSREQQDAGHSALNDLLNKVAKERNMIAHGHIFGHGDDHGGAIIATWRAQGRLEDKNLILTTDVAFDSIAKLFSIAHVLNNLAELVKIHPANLEAAAAAYTD